MNHVGSLTCLNGPNRGKEYKLTERISTVGRSNDCTIIINENLISRNHAEIHKVDAAYQLHDLGSKNGIHIDNERLAHRAAVWLKNGNEITFAYTRFSFTELAATDTVTSTFILAPQEPALRVDLSAREVYVDGQLIDPPFSVKQFELLLFFVKNRNRAVSKDDIAQAIWPEYQGDVYNSSVDRMVSRVRHRIEPTGGHSPRFISTVHGYGYKLRLDG